MRRIAATFGLVLAFGGAVALMPLLAAIGAGVFLSVGSVGLGIWRWIRKRDGRKASGSTPAADVLAGVP